MAVCHRSEIRIYDRFGAGSPVAIPATGIKGSKSLGGGGFLSFSVDARIAALVTTPGLLDDCVIKHALPLTEPGTTLTEVAAFANRKPAGTLWDGAGRRTRVVQSAGSLWTVWAQDPILHTEANTIPQMAPDQRYFAWQATIYDPDTDPDYTWDTPDEVATQAAATGKRAGKPEDWPADVDHAVWITRPSGGDADETRHLFVKDVTFDTDGMRRLLFSGDESCAVYFAAALMIQTSESETGYTKLNARDVWITPGTYRVAIDKTSVVSRGGDGYDPVLLAIVTLDDSDEITDVDLITDDTWAVYTMEPTGVAPSLTPGEILLELHAQAAARGVDTWAAITPDFDAAEGSDGNPWQVREERTWRVGYDSHLDMVEGLGDLGVDPDITPGLAFKAHADRGTDRSATVTIEALVNADEITETGAGVTATFLAVETQDGWTLVENAAAAAEYGRREQALSLGNAPSIAQGTRLGQKVLDERLARPSSERTVHFYAVDGCVPFEDFDLGDTVTIKIGAAAAPGVVLDLGWEAPSTEAILRWTAKVGEVLT